MSVIKCRQIVCIASVLSAMVLSGCTQLEYRDLVMPETEEGKECVYQCEVAKEHCDEREELIYNNCRDVYDRLHEIYNICERTRSDPSVSCTAPRICEPSNGKMCRKHFRTCWKSCGGTVAGEKERSRWLSSY